MKILSDQEAAKESERAAMVKKNAILTKKLQIQNVKLERKI